MEKNTGLNQLKENIQKIYGEKGTKWVANLPMLVDKLQDYWKLKHIVPVDNMSFNFVAKAITEHNQRVVLKIGLDKKLMESEKQALDFFLTNPL